MAESLLVGRNFVSDCKLKPKKLKIKNKKITENLFFFCKKIGFYQLWSAQDDQEPPGPGVTIVINLVFPMIGYRLSPNLLPPSNGVY